MKIKQTKIFTMLLLFVLTFASASSLSSVYAKNMNIPENTVITYYTGATFEITLPFTLTIPVKPGLTYHVNTIDLRCAHVETGSIASGNYIVVHFITDVPAYPDVPWAVLTTSTDTDFSNFWKTLLIGTPVYIPRLLTMSFQYQTRYRLKDTVTE